MCVTNQILHVFKNGGPNMDIPTLHLKLSTDVVLNQTANSHLLEMAFLLLKCDDPLLFKLGVSRHILSKTWIKDIN